MMNLYCCFSPAHQGLFQDWFAPSIPSGIHLVPHRLENVVGPGDFLSPEFLQCIRLKLDLILTSLAQNPGQCLIWSDVDIIFGRVRTHELEKLIEQSNHRILFQREHPRLQEANTGFFLTRSCPEVIEFFEKVRQGLLDSPEKNEQMVVNELLAKEDRPLVGFLPNRFYARTHGWPPPLDFAIYHANYTKGPDGVGQKVEQLKRARSIQKNGLPALIWSCAQQLQKRIASALTPKN